MGFDVSLVQSEERHYGAFVCAICQNLVDLDGLVTTTCAHCFCKACLTTWLDRSRRTCPTCNRDLLYANNHAAGGCAANSHQSMMIGDHTVLVRPLRDAQPLAHRLLQSVLVRCPLRTTVACSWKGDYGDLEAHLLSKTAHCCGTDGATKEEPSGTCVTVTEVGNDDDDDDDDDDVDAHDHHHEQQISLASSLKEEANGKFQSGHFREAESLYSKAIEVLAALRQKPLSPSEKVLLAALYSNRAAACLQMQQFARCLDDCERVIHQQLDPTNAKVYVRAARANIHLGRLRGAERVLSDGHKLHPNNRILAKETGKVDDLLELEARGQRELSSELFAAAKGTFGSLLHSAPSAAPFLLGAAQADLGLGLTDSALTLTKRVLVGNPQNPQGYWIRGQVVFLMGDDPKGAMQLLQEALRLDPDSEGYKQSYKRAKRVQAAMTEARKLVFRRAFGEAVARLTDALEALRPLPAKSALYAQLHTRRAEAHLRLKDYPQAMKDCARVVYSQEDHTPAWLIRFKAHHGLGEHETALEEVTELLRKWPHDDRLRQAYDRADFLVRRERRVDFYGLLGVPSIASEMEIKKAYKKRALRVHPDKLPPGSSAEAQQAAQRRFQQLGEALEILCDDFQRKLYDEGYDPAAIRDRVEAAKQAARNPRGRYPHGQHHHHR